MRIFKLFACSLFGVYAMVQSLKFAGAAIYIVTKMATPGALFGFALGRMTYGFVSMSVAAAIAIVLWKSAMKQTGAIPVSESGHPIIPDPYEVK